MSRSRGQVQEDEAEENRQAEGASLVSTMTTLCFCWAQPWPPSYFPGEKWLKVTGLDSKPAPGGFLAGKVLVENRPKSSRLGDSWKWWDRANFSGVVVECAGDRRRSWEIIGGHGQWGIGRSRVPRGPRSPLPTVARCPGTRFLPARRRRAKERVSHEELCQAPGIFIIIIIITSSSSSSSSSSSRR